MLTWRNHNTMGQVIVKRSKETVALEYREYIHRCGEVVNLIVQGSQIAGYADVSKVRISVCPHCLRDLDFEDLQVPDNVEAFGWPF